MTKKILLLFIVLLSANRAMTQEKQFKEVLTSKTWKVDIEAMKPAILIKVGLVPEMAQLSKSEKELVVKSLLTTLSKMKYAFFNDFTHQLTVNDKITTGNYAVNEIQDEITLQHEKVEDEVYAVVSFDENRISLSNKKNKNELILIPVN